MEDENEHSQYPPHPVKHPLMFQGWENLTFLHWRYPPEVIRPLLPDDIELDTFDNRAWIGLTPFLLTRLRPRGLPGLPGISRFPEMNVRTYVRGPDRERGIWFFSLEAHRLAAVVGARLSYGLPYRWASMSVREHDAHIEYRSRRHSGAGGTHIVIRPGSLIRPDDLAIFLTARYRLYTLLAGRLAYAQVEHPPWSLRSAIAVRLDQNVIEHSGVPGPTGKPVVHFSPGVYVRVGGPRFVDRPGTA
jgi:uncharacterized protein YqjF (DUF2071 family)